MCGSIRFARSRAPVVRHVCVACVVCACVLLSVPAARVAAAIVDARWATPVSGDWTDPAQWSTNPFYPNNGNPAESVYQVRLDVPGPDYTVTLSAPVEVGSTLISSPAATLEQSGGTFNVGSLSLGALGGAADYRMTGGSLTVNELSVGYNSLGSENTSAGSFEQLSGQVDVTGAVRVGIGPSFRPATGTLIVSGPGTRYNAVSTSLLQAHRIGDSAGGTGVALFTNFASVTLGRAEIGISGGMGTTTVDAGAKVAINELYVGQSGTGTIYLRASKDTRLNYEVDASTSSRSRCP